MHLAGLLVPPDGAAHSPFVGLDGFDLVFVLTAVAFQLLIIAILIAAKWQRLVLVRRLGTLWLLLAIPLAIVLLHDLFSGERGTLVPFSLIFSYMAVDLLLDYILRIEFRQKPALHIPYIILEYGALIGLIWLAFAIGPTWGYLVSFFFWLLLATVVYVYWDQITGKHRRPG
jgi:hypothetical protein